MTDKQAAAIQKIVERMRSFFVGPFPFDAASSGVVRKWADEIEAQLKEKA